MALVRIQGLATFAALMLLTAAGAHSVDVPASREIDVRAFGAKGDYNTDDTGAIQRALDATDSVWGGVVHLEAGGYVISHTLVINHPHIALIGSGGTASQLIVRRQTFNVIEVDASNSTVISNLWINSYGHGPSQTWAIFDPQKSYNLSIQDVELSGGHSGIYATGGASYFRHIRLTRLAKAVGIGIEFSGNTEIHEILSIYMENAADQNALAGIKIDSGADFTIVDGQIQKMGTPLLVQPEKAPVFSLNASSSWFDTSSGPAAFFDGTAQPVTRLDFTGCWFGSSEYGIKLSGRVFGLHVQNSEIVDNARDGVFVAAGSQLRQARFDTLQVANNRESGIHIGSGVGGWAISNSTIGEWGDFAGNGRGLLIDSGNASFYSVTGNVFSGNQRGDVFDGGTGSARLILNNIIRH